MNVPQDVLETLQAARRLLVVGHVNPDADCLGAMLATAAGLTDSAGKQAVAVLPADSAPRKLGFLVEITGNACVSDACGADYDALVVVDTARAKRVNVEGGLDALAPGQRPIVNIDHHVTNTRFGSANWVEAEASSTSEMIYVLMRQAGWQITRQIATCLYAGLHGDTAGFSLPASSPSSLRVAGELVAAGADVAAVGERLYRSMGESEFALSRVFYHNTRVTAGGKIAYSTASFAEIAATRCTAADIDDQVAIPRMIGGIRMAMLFTEGQPGKIRINLRGEGGTNVVELAQAFGGGGHTTSAGTIVKGALDEVVRRVLDEATRRLGG